MRSDGVIADVLVERFPHKKRGKALSVKEYVRAVGISAIGIWPF